MYVNKIRENQPLKLFVVFVDENLKSICEGENLKKKKRKIKSNDQSIKR